jgi:hypothetical protein
VKWSQAGGTGAACGGGWGGEFVVDSMLLMFDCAGDPAPAPNSIAPTGGCAGLQSGDACAFECSAGYTGSPSYTCDAGTWGPLVGSCAESGEKQGLIARNGSTILHMQFILIFHTRIVSCCII